MGDYQNLKSIFMRKNLTPKELLGLVELIKNICVSLFGNLTQNSPNIISTLNLCKISKTTIIKFKPKIQEAHEVEVKNLVCGFIREEQHLDKLANIVSIIKKNWKVCICIDFIDLNDACFKDEFALPIIESLLTKLAILKECSSWMHHISMHHDHNFSLPYM